MRFSKIHFSSVFFPFTLFLLTQQQPRASPPRRPPTTRFPPRSGAVASCTLRRRCRILLFCLKLEVIDLGCTARAHTHTHTGARGPHSLPGRSVGRSGFRIRHLRCGRAWVEAGGTHGDVDASGHQAVAMQPISSTGCFIERFCLYFFKSYLKHSRPLMRSTEPQSKMLKVRNCQMFDVKKFSNSAQSSSSFYGAVFVQF